MEVVLTTLSWLWLLKENAKNNYLEYNKIHTLDKIQRKVDNYNTVIVNDNIK